MELRDFGTNPAKVRISKDLSAYELSLMIGKDPSYIHKVETAKLNISLNVVFDICKVLNIQPKVLFE